MPTCRFCGQETDRLVDSHIVPRALMLLDKEPADPLAVLGRESVARSWVGPYDRMYCNSCEQQFAIPDQHLIEFVKRLDGGEPIYPPTPHHRELLGWQFEADQADPHLLQLAAMGVLLRAHHSTQPFFEHVTLGPHATRLKQMVREGRATDRVGFPVLLARANSPFASGAWKPAATRRYGRRGYFFNMATLQFFIMADSQPLPEGLRVIALGGRPKVFVAKHELSAREKLMIQDLIRGNEDRLERMFGRPVPRRG